MVYGVCRENVNGSYKSVLFGLVLCDKSTRVLVEKC